MRKVVLIFILCTLVAGLSFGQEKVVIHHTDLVDSPTSYIIPYGNISFTLRMYPCPIHEEVVDTVDGCVMVDTVDAWKGNGTLIKIRTTPFKNFILGISIKEDGFISCGTPPAPKVEDVGILMRYGILKEPIALTVGLDVIEYVRWARRRGLYIVMGIPAKGFANTVFPYLGGSAFLSEGMLFGATFGGAEIVPIEGVNFLIDWSWLSGKGNFVDGGIRFRLTEGLWLEFDVRNIEDVIKGGEEWNRMLRVWYEWRAPPPRR